MSKKRTRSKTGCLICRQRKKKCDERHPICTFCDVRGLDCQWDIKILDLTTFQNNKVTKPKQRKHDKVLDLPELEIDFPSPATDGIVVAASSPESFNTTIIDNLSSPLFLFLDPKGLEYINYFENSVADSLSISPKSHNYFKKTFFTLAFTSEAILNLLAAWGALFHKNGDNEDVERYLQIAKSSLIKPNKNNNNKFDYFIMMAYYLISIGIRVNSGDTSQWYELFHNCEILMRQYGGLQKFIKDFEYSEDCKFFLATFQFRDIMSSESLKRGTICTINNYNNLFGGNDDNYGLDPYQGCCQSIIIVLGEIMNTYVELKRERMEIIEKLDKDIDVTEQRLKHFEKVNRSINDLLTKVDDCIPFGQLQELDEDERELQLELFELNRITCKMYLLLYIKQTQPTSTEIQILLLKALQLMDDLIIKKKNNVVNCLNMALLICGISSSNKFDRNNVRMKFNQVYSNNFKVGNIKRIWDIVEESWIRNSSGKICIDWLDICHDFGWKISMG